MKMLLAAPNIVRLPCCGNQHTLRNIISTKAIIYHYIILKNSKWNTIARTPIAIYSLVNHPACFSHSIQVAFRIQYRILANGFKHTPPSFHILAVCINPYLIISLPYFYSRNEWIIIFIIVE